MRDCCFFKTNDPNFQHIFSILASVQFPGLLLLAVFLRVLMEMIRSAHRVMGMDIGFESHFPKFFSFPLQIDQWLQ